MNEATQIKDHRERVERLLEPFRGSLGNDYNAYRGAHADVVNACGKGDWIDATGGKVRKGLSRDQVAQVEAAIPSYGFADILQRLAKDLGGTAFKGNMRVLSHVFKI